jgi:hypothetical protein
MSDWKRDESAVSAALSSPSNTTVSPRTATYAPLQRDALALLGQGGGRYVPDGGMPVSGTDAG